MSKCGFVLLATIGLALPNVASAKTPDDRYCGMSIKDERGEMQLLLFKLKKREVIEDDLVKAVQADGGTVECGANMREAHDSVSELQLQNVLDRHRMLNTPSRFLYRPNFPRPRLP